MHSSLPLWDLKYGMGEYAQSHRVGEELIGTGPESDVETHAAAQQPGTATAERRRLEIHMPRPSIFPALAGLGIGMLAAGVIYHPIISIIGLLWIFMGIYGWSFEPAAGEPAVVEL